MQQHYLPQSYLKGFCDPNTPKSQEPYVWVYTLKDGQWKKRAPKNIAKGADLYSFKDKEGRRNDEIEKLLSEIEGQMAELIRGKIGSRKPLDEKVVATIATFVGFMAVRIPAFHQQVADLVTDIVEMVMKMQASRPEAFPALRAEFERDTGEKLPDWFGPEHFDPSRYVIKPSKSLVVGLALSPVKEIAYALANMSWVFFLAGADTNFVTSDRPYCIVNPKLVGSFYGPGLAQKDVEVTIPLASTTVLYASWRPQEEFYRDSTPHLTELINKRSMAFAVDFLISARREFPGHEILGAEKRQAAAGNSRE